MMPLSESFKEIFEPRVTCIPPRFADRALMKTEDGEIRCYGANVFLHEDGRREYHYVVRKSRDNGMSFFEEDVPADDPGARVRSPWSGDYLTLLCLKESEPGGVSGNNCEGIHNSAAVQGLPHSEGGLYIARSTQGPDGPWTFKKVLDKPLFMQRLILPLKSRKRWLCTASKRINHVDHPYVLLSDDDGETWRVISLPPTPCFDGIKPPHKGNRWIQCGCEPVVAETKTGRLIMLLRTSTDVHCWCHSDDGGETWSAMEPSPFFAVATMPGLYTLSDGRILAIWNNTTPLPELDHTHDVGGGPDYLVSGEWEDVFTNRDALHAAISEDNGETWIGYREIALNDVRNASDFRTTCGGSPIMNDKSIHQNQIIELPQNKVLVHYGQHPASTRLMVFDLDFLYAKKRSDRFFSGLDFWSTQLYVKSPYGGCAGYGSGHCSYNRRPGAQLMRASDTDWHEALVIGRHPDERLVSDREGAVWNFPAGRKGTVTMDLSIPAGSQGLRISLCDRWLNPCDDYVKDQAVFSFVLDNTCSLNGTKLADSGERFTLTIAFDLDAGSLTATTAAGSISMPVTQTLKAPFGEPRQISYLHLQSAAETADCASGRLYQVEATIQ